MNFRTIKISDPAFEPKGFRYITVKSNALNGRADITIYIPECAKGKGGISAIVLLHGVYGSHWAWTMNGNAHNTLEDMIRRDESKPFILIMPSDGLWGDGSGYVDHGIQNFEKWIGEEVPALVKQTINEVDEDSQFFISGLSMGGYGAFRIGLNYPQQFKGISSHSSLTDLNQIKSFVEEDWSFWDEKQPGSIQELISNAVHLPAIRFDCGLDDDLLMPNRTLHEFLEHSNIDHKYEEFAGGHEWEYWRDKIRNTYAFFSKLIET